MYRNIRKFISLFLIIFIALFVGCTSSNFEVVAPPVKEFATPVPYEKTEVIQGTFIVEKSFRGNKVDNTLSVTSDAQTIKGFTVGEKGVVTYVYKGTTYDFDAVVTSCPTEGIGNFIAEYGTVSDVIPDQFPGKFSVITYKQEDSIMVSKGAVLVLDDNGNAIVLQLDENGLIVEKNIVVGYSNESYYQVIEGINVGEKVVMR